MKKIVLLTCIFSLFTTLVFSQITTTPAPAIASGAVTINFDKTGTPLAAYTGVIYAHMGITVNGVQWTRVIGAWGNNTNQPALTLVSGTTYKLDIIPDLYTYFGVPTTSTITQICVVLRNALGTAKTADTFLNVGAFQATLTAPLLNSTTIVNSGTSLTITANNTNGDASYNLLVNGTSVNTFSGSVYSFTDDNIIANKSYDLQITQGTTTFSRKFSVIVNPGTVSQVMPSGLEDGINYNSGDATKATLVLTAPGKDFVYVAGSFNNWQPTGVYSMKKDEATGKFWLELTGLVSGATNSYQYWVVDQTPTTNSPVLVKTADPFSTLVLSPYDDPYIPSANYPNIPAYPKGQEREVTILKTGKTPYNWQITNFTKPEKEKLVVYELLVRDFDSNKSFQNLIDRIDYFKNLKINAIELMPVMEFEGNESWGYNTSFHLALDKMYGTADKFKELIDLYHQNGIAVILDVALNHAFDRNPMDRMWMSDPDGDGWGGPASDNPYFNVTATHSYSVGNDFNHSSDYTKYYTKRVIKQWIEEFHIDGFRWDLTKGFTQNCTGSDACTNSYQQDRVDILKDYVDYSWSLDPSHYAIFEHLGAANEEQQWANYRINETPSKGVMMWSEQFAPYTQLIEGNGGNKSISGMNNTSKGFTKRRVLGYPESHDKDRLMFQARQYGASAEIKTLAGALKRMASIAAVSLPIPGPKMIWQFAELGWDSSIYTCTDGTYNDETATKPYDCKLATKSVYQWSQSWMTVPERKALYDTYARINDLKINEAVFNGSVTVNSGTFTPSIYIWDDAIPSTSLKNVVILSNFNTTAQNITGNFPYVGIWYNLMDNTPLVVNATTDQITIEAGGFRMYGNKPTTLATDTFETMNQVSLFPNPSSNYFTINTNTTKVQIYSITGQLVKSFGKKSNEYQFEIGDLKNGIYLVKASAENNREKTMKLIKQ
ncbi:alpha-amylase family glycosyl hydrolase [Flavobacterium psychrotolerans]|uniref:Alpha-amylase n=1 Tax=Flavobacterium psychrotolerans TaxID=2169410 RepID=A0A2U1JNV5_9FLAO|nr:alpha-amylase family glycosyl hydrolase [Flavobacterium psychrotolerans]PWA06812.1 alpha-amylase [Flavobacterium psychrotolerans]